MTLSPFRYFKAWPGIIQLAVTLHVRFPLSSRNVEDILREREIDVCRESVRFEVDRFGARFARTIGTRMAYSMRQVKQ